MPLFGPIGSAANGGALYGVDLDSGDYTMQMGRPRPLPIFNGLLYPSLQPPATTATTTSPTAATTTAATAPPLPAMQSIGTFTTRRTQLFGPLSSISI